MEPLAEELFVCGWVYITSLAADAYAASKWDVGPDQRCYRLIYNQASGAFQFSVSSSGAAGTVVNATSTYAEVVDTW